MLIFDGDYPMAYGAIDLDRDLTAPLDDVRTGSHGQTTHEGWPDDQTMATLPEMRLGHVVGALVKVVGRIRKPDGIIWGYRTADIAYSAAHAHLAYYRILEARGELRILSNSKIFRDHMAEWEAADDHTNLPVGIVIGMEGADPISWPEQVGEWWLNGLRVVSLSHYGASNYSHGTGTGTEGGLFPPAKELLKNMDELGIVLDITHTSDTSVREALDIFKVPILASHQNCRGCTPGERQHPDDLIRAVIDRGGVIGHSMDTWMLYKGGADWANIRPRREVFSKADVTLEDWGDHVDYVSQLAGNTLHSGIGGDTDGQGGREGAPHEIDTIADYQMVGEVLSKRGYSDEDVTNVMYRNWQRFYEDALPDETDCITENTETI